MNIRLWIFHKTPNWLWYRLPEWLTYLCTKEYLNHIYKVG